jgi:hypothetical protein
MVSALFSTQLSTDMHQVVFALYIGAIALAICTPLAIALTVCSTVVDWTVEQAKNTLYSLTH